MKYLHRSSCSHVPVPCSVIEILVVNVVPGDTVTQTLSASVEDANVMVAPQPVPRWATWNKNCSGTLLKGTDEVDVMKSSKVSATASQPAFLAVYLITQGFWEEMSRRLHHRMLTNTQVRQDIPLLAFHLTKHYTRHRIRMIH